MKQPENRTAAIAAGEKTQKKAGKRHLYRKKRLFPVYLLLLGLAGWLMAGCARPRPVTFVGYRNLRVIQPSFTSTGINADLVFYNPNAYPMQMKEASMDIFLNNDLLGHFSQDSLLRIPARDTFYYPVQLKVSLSGLLGKLLNTNLQDSLTLRGTGTCKVGRGGFFMHLPINFEQQGRLKLY
ncbi:LEA type 2 family protein [Compostibacter hankyongensis]|uniref:Late embryogenesis abundant protein LEA-2 subgroup domain-containing protein n=1 Tax=Compostibacter hankyongensis TaxID=1007089 RepID=A0ABP8G1Z6_9BACT